MFLSSGFDESKSGINYLIYYVLLGIVAGMDGALWVTYTGKTGNGLNGPFWLRVMSIIYITVYGIDYRPFCSKAVIRRIRLSKVGPFRHFAESHFDYGIANEFSAAIYRTRACI